MTPFSILSPEGLPLRGDFDVAERPRALVIVVHGFKGFKDWGFFPWLSQRLMQHRLIVCRFNMSRSGIGEDPESFDRLDLFEHDTYSTQLRDLATVVGYAQECFPNLPTFILGHSRGGGVGILGALDVPNLRGVVAWSPISRVDRWDEATQREWRARGVLEVENARTHQIMRMSPVILDDYEANRERLDILAATERLRVPLLIVHGGSDESVPVAEGRVIAERSPQSSMVVIHRASHTFNAIHPLIDVSFALIAASEVSAHFINAYA